MSYMVSAWDVEGGASGYVQLLRCDSLAEARERGKSIRAADVLISDGRGRIWKRNRHGAFSLSTGYDPQVKLRVGDIVHIDTDNREWGRVASDGRVVGLQRGKILVDVFSVRAALLVPRKDIVGCAPRLLPERPVHMREM
jgi:hypothetical protein